MDWSRSYLSVAGPRGVETTGCKDLLLDFSIFWWMALGEYPHLKHKSCASPLHTQLKLGGTSARHQFCVQVLEAALPASFSGLRVFQFSWDTQPFQCGWITAD
jgi:hypothetical protein